MTTTSLRDYCVLFCVASWNPWKLDVSFRICLRSQASTAFVLMLLLASGHNSTLEMERFYLLSFQQCYTPYRYCFPEKQEFFHVFFFREMVRVKHFGITASRRLQALYTFRKMVSTPSPVRASISMKSFPYISEGHFNNFFLRFQKAKEHSMKWLSKLIAENQRTRKCYIRYHLSAETTQMIYFLGKRKHLFFVFIVSNLKQ